MSSINPISQKEYLKKYLSGDTKKKKKKRITGGNFKRSVLVDDDIDLKSMRPLEDDEVELYQMDEDAPQVAGIVDERPAEVKAQEHYSSKRWKVFGGDDGLNIVDSMNQDTKVLRNLNSADGSDVEVNSHNKKSKLNITDGKRIKPTKEIVLSDDNKTNSRDKGFSSSTKSRPKYEKSLSSDRQHQNISDQYETRGKKGKTYCEDSDASPPRKRNKNSSDDSDASPPRMKHTKTLGKDRHDSDESPPRKDFKKKLPKYSSRYQERSKEKHRNRSNSISPPRRGKTKNHKYNSDSDSSPPRKEKNSYKKDKSDSDASPPRKHKYNKYDKISTSSRYKYQDPKSDSDSSPPRKYPDNDKSHGRGRRGFSSDSDNSPSRRDRRRSPKPVNSKKRSSRSKTPPEKHNSYKLKQNYNENPPGQFRRDNEKIHKRHAGDLDDSSRSRKRNEGSDSDLSPPRKDSIVGSRPLKKVLYKPNDDSSSDEGHRSKGKKMKTTLDGKQAGLQDAKQLKKELSDLKMKEESMFSKMDASVSGVGAAAVKRDRKTGQIRDMEKEREAQREKEAKESVVKEKYSKWGRGIKQTEDAAVRAAEVMKEMNKPLARYADDKDLDDFLKAQDREGDPMLDYIKKKQSEAMSPVGEKRIYQGPFPPNRFNIRPGCRWDGVVRSNGYEKEWFQVKNAKKARDEEAYKWSTSDM